VTAGFPWRQPRLEVVADGFHCLEGPRWRDALLYLCAAPPGRAFDSVRRPLGVLISVQAGTPAA
jgi:hypothetical protein